MYKINKPDGQILACVLWCLCMGKGERMAEEREKRKWF